MPRKGPSRGGSLDTQLRKWVLKSDITKIRKLIMDGANPNFISQQVPDARGTIVSNQSSPAHCPAMFDNLYV